MMFIIFSPLKSRFRWYRPHFDGVDQSGTIPISRAVRPQTSTWSLR